MQRGFELVGVDFALSAIAGVERRVEKAWERVEFVVDDLTNLRKVNGTFLVRKRGQVN